MEIKLNFSVFWKRLNSCDFVVLPDFLHMFEFIILSQTTNVFSLSHCQAKYVIFSDSTFSKV